jgi:hypothetical protein
MFLVFKAGRNWDILENSGNSIFTKDHMYCIGVASLKVCKKASLVYKPEENGIF